MRLLLVAPTCDGEDIGEAWVTYQWVRRLATVHDVTVLTYAKRGKSPLARQLPGIEVVAWREPPFMGRAERLNSLLKPGYVPFYLSARRWLRGALASGRTFDIAHQLAPVAMRYPSPLAGLSVPYVIGPVGGGLATPDGWQAEDDTSPWYVELRRADRWRLTHDPLLRRTYEGAACVVGIGEYTRALLTGLRLRRFEVMNETGIEQLPEPGDRREQPGPVRLLFVGRVIRTKGVRDLVRAVGLLPLGSVTLDVLGDGFDAATCAGLASSTGVQEWVTFHGWLGRGEVEHFLRAADIFVFPSYREPGGNAVLEAMSFGLPTIVADRGGSADSVDDSCGIRISPTTPEEYAQRIADAIADLVADPTRRLRMGLAARERIARLYLWDSKIERMGRLYEELLTDSP